MTVGEGVMWVLYVGMVAVLWVRNAAVYEGDVGQVMLWAVGRFPDWCLLRVLQIPRAWGEITKGLGKGAERGCCSFELSKNDLCFR